MRTLLVATCLAAACGGPSGATHAGHAGHAPSGFNLAYDPAIPHIVPRPLFDFLEQHQWGDYHLTFHMARRYYVAGARTRAWLDEIGVGPAPLQEGDVGSGVEFLVMHRAMIDFLRGQFGGLPLAPTEANDGATTVGAMLDGWADDATMRAHLVAAGQDPSMFDAATAALAEPSRFATEDEFGRFLQTSLRLQPGPGDERVYVQDRTPGIGVHNLLHNQLGDGGPIDIGNPQVNLASQLFWGLHGWVDATWRRFEATHVRSADEQRRFDELTTEYKTHMQQHGGGHRGPPDHVIRKPAPDLVSELAGKAFSTVITCADLAPGTTSPDCP